MDVTIRPEEARDYAAVENLTREAFWNVYSPGCSEHYIVHRGRGDAEFIPELSLVLEVPYDAEGSVVGVTKGNAALLEGVNRAIAAAKEDGSFEQYVVEAMELASGEYAYLQDGEIVEQ